MIRRQFYETDRGKIHQPADRFRLQANFWNGNGRQVVKDVSYLNPEHVGDVMREYEASKMAYRDIKNSIDTAKREGKIEANTETAQRLLAMGLSPEQVAKATLLPLKIIENLRNS